MLEIGFGQRARHGCDQIVSDLAKFDLKFTSFLGVKFRNVGVNGVIAPFLQCRKRNADLSGGLIEIAPVRIQRGQRPGLLFVAVLPMFPHKLKTPRSYAAVVPTVVGYSLGWVLKEGGGLTQP